MSLRKAAGIFLLAMLPVLVIGIYYLVESTNESIDNTAPSETVNTRQFPLSPSNYNGGNYCATSVLKGDVLEIQNCGRSEFSANLNLYENADAKSRKKARVNNFSSDLEQGETFTISLERTRGATASIFADNGFILGGATFKKS